MEVPYIRGISGAQAKRLAEGVQQAMTSIRSAWSLDIFLCGANPKERDSLRTKLHRLLLQSPSSERYRFHFPERVFADELVGPLTTDLLSMENILARGVDVVLLIPESPGSIAELGAFANHDGLRTKMLVVIDKKFEKNRSFIMEGPIRLLRGMKGGRRVYFADPTDLSLVAEALDRRLWRFRWKDEDERDVFGIFQIENFILACLYLAEPLDERELAALVAAGRGARLDTDATVVRFGVRALLDRGVAYLGNDGVHLTRKGIDSVYAPNKASRITSFYDLKIFDRLRIDLLTVLCGRDVHGTPGREERVRIAGLGR